MNYSLDIEKPWYFAGGKRYPKPAEISQETKKRVAKLYPNESPSNDRVIDQLMFVPSNYEQIQKSGEYKTILLYGGFEAGFWLFGDRGHFQFEHCPVNTCKLTTERNLSDQADLIFYADFYTPTGVPKPPHQLYMLHLIECPNYSPHYEFPDVFNWTSTYR